MPQADLSPAGGPPADGGTLRTKRTPDRPSGGLFGHLGVNGSGDPGVVHGDNTNLLVLSRGWYDGSPANTVYGHNVASNNWCV
ncbi:hypothetical protein AB0E04_40715 [Streptomyces sp. NPDC048251]|uniref:hypothetical protein n=1 Tax=Streptomyces sp. NPDC048251 TaxID=3154501 RepID=UPI00342BAF94